MYRQGLLHLECVANDAADEDDDDGSSWLSFWCNAK